MENIPINEILKERRLKEGISTDKIFHEAHLPSKYIYLIESGDWKSFPSQLHIKRFVRLYADYLKIPKELVEKNLKEIITELNRNKAAAGGKNMIIASQQDTFKPRKALYILLLSVLLFILVYLAILYLLPE